MLCLFPVCSPVEKAVQAPSGWGRGWGGVEMGIEMGMEGKSSKYNRLFWFTTYLGSKD